MSYTFCFNDEVLGTVLDNHLGLGWMTTRCTPSPGFLKYELFFEKFREASKLTAYSDESLRALKELKKQYGDLMKPASWTIRDSSGNSINRMATVPITSIHPDYFSATWKRK